MTPTKPVLSLAPLAGRINLFDLQRQRERLGGDLHRRIETVLQHGQFILGPEVDELEQQLADFAGVAHTIAVSSGRDALMIALMAMGVGVGDAVFVPAFTFAATGGAVVSVGATPVFVDVDPVTFNMSASDLHRAMSEVIAEGRLAPKVVMPVDLYGLPADYAALSEVAGQFGGHVLADSAQSFGGAHNGVAVGALAPITATSFYPTKPLGCYGDGGAILTSDADLADSVRAIRSHGRAGDGDEAMVLGLTGRLDTLQAAVLLAKLELFSDELARRRAISQRYDEALGGIVTVPVIPDGYDSAFALYTIRVNDRDQVRARLDEHGVGTGLFYRLALHQHPAFSAFASRTLPASVALAEEVLSLPLHADLHDDEVDQVIAVVREVMACGS
ncbi:MAG: DegT/DnrJ/EryC1/StrS family aminotransferase [Alphaproteobacteria bacterium]